MQQDCLNGLMGCLHPHLSRSVLVTVIPHTAHWVAPSFAPGHLKSELFLQKCQIFFIWDVVAIADTLFVEHPMTLAGDAEASWGFFHIEISSQDLRVPCIRWHHSMHVKPFELLTHLLPLRFLIYSVMIWNGRSHPVSAIQVFCIF